MRLAYNLFGIDADYILYKNRYKQTEKDNEYFKRTRTTENKKIKISYEFQKYCFIVGLFLYIFYQITQAYPARFSFLSWVP